MRIRETKTLEWLKPGAYEWYALESLIKELQDFYNSVDNDDGTRAEVRITSRGITLNGFREATPEEIKESEDLFDDETNYCEECGRRDDW